MGDEFNKFGEWEEAWQRTFDGSEQAPPSKVWQGVENSLMEQQLRRYKRKLFVYQWLAAASVLLLGFWAGWWLFFAQPQGTGQFTSSSSTKNAADTAAEPESNTFSGFRNGSAAGDNTSASNDAAATTAEVAATDNAAATTAEVAATGNVAASNAAAGEALVLSLPANGVTSSQSVSGANTGTDAAKSLNIGSTTDAAKSSQVAAVRNRQAADVSAPAETGLAATPQLIIVDEALLERALDEEVAQGFSVLSDLTGPEISALKASLALEKGNIEKELRVVAISRRVTKKKNTRYNGNTWLGASVGSTFFDPNVGNNGTNSLAWTEQPVPVKGGQVYSANASNWDEKESSLPSLSFSLDAAFRINKRWILQSSLEYGTYKVGIMSGSYTDEEGNVTYPLYYTNFSNDKLQVVNPNSRRAAPVNALSTYNFVSVPLVFNYVFLEQRFGLSLGTGLSTDIFLGGRIADQERHLHAYNIGAGPNSPFNRLHFNALLSAQLFYRAGPFHLLTLEPTYKYSLTNFNKESSYFNSRPRQLGVAVGFRYILR